MAEASLRQGDRNELNGDYEQLTLGLPNSAIVKVRLAAQLPDQEQERARDLCLEAIQLEPMLAMAYDQLGIITTRIGEFEAAEGYFQQSLNLDPSRSLAQIHLGWLYLQRSRLDAASEYLLAALKRDPSDPDANILMGSVYLRTGVVDQADLHFSRALCARPHDPFAIEGKARAVITMRDWTRAEEILRDGLDANPKDRYRDLLLLLARVLISRGDETKSRHFYEAALVEAQAAMGHAGRRVQATQHGGPGPANEHSPARAMHETGDPWFLAAVAAYRMSARGRAEGRTPGVIPRRDRHERLAVDYLHTCLKHHPQHREAAHLLALLEDQRPVNPQVLGQWSIIVVAIALLATLWITFLESTRVSQNTVLILSPILIGLLVIASLLPFLERFKLPGIEADVRSPPDDLESPAPLGDVSLGELAAESLSPGTDRATLPTAPQAPGNVRRYSAAIISVSALVGENL
jgi:tetratricopeptide (TPR) repeat protein